MMYNLNILLVTFGACLSLGSGFSAVGPVASALKSNKYSYSKSDDMNRHSALFMSDGKRDDGVIELVDIDEPSEMASNGEENSKSTVAPFLSQGSEIAEDVLNPDLSNPKQARVIIYIILSLLPVLFLVPLMLGSREFLPAIIPMDEMPPVQL